MLFSTDGVHMHVWACVYNRGASRAARITVLLPFLGRGLTQAAKLTTPASKPGVKESTRTNNVLRREMAI